MINSYDRHKCLQLTLLYFADLYLFKFTRVNFTKGMEQNINPPKLLFHSTCNQRCPKFNFHGVAGKLKTPSARV